MKLFIKANDYELWRLIVNGLLISKKKVAERKLVMEESEWDANDIKIAQLNAKALHILFYASGLLNTIECHYVTSWKSLMKAQIK